MSGSECHAETENYTGGRVTPRKGWEKGRCKKCGHEYYVDGDEAYDNLWEYAEHSLHAHRALAASQAEVERLRDRLEVVWGRLLQGHKNSHPEHWTNGVPRLPTGCASCLVLFGPRDQIGPGLYTSPSPPEGGSSRGSMIDGAERPEAGAPPPNPSEGLTPRKRTEVGG